MIQGNPVICISLHPSSPTLLSNRKLYVVELVSLSFVFVLRRSNDGSSAQCKIKTAASRSNPKPERQQRKYAKPNEPKHEYPSPSHRVNTKICNMYG